MVGPFGLCNSIWAADLFSNIIQLEKKKKERWKRDKRLEEVTKNNKEERDR